MNSVSEVTIKISNEDQKYSKKFLEYEPLTLSHDNNALKAFVDQAISEFKGSIDTVDIKVTYRWQ